MDCERREPVHVKRHENSKDDLVKVLKCFVLSRILKKRLAQTILLGPKTIILRQFNNSFLVFGKIGHDFIKLVRKLIKSKLFS